MEKNRLCAGIARVDITPEIGACLYGYYPDFHSESVRDNLTATAFAFECGEIRALMITACVCIINTQLDKKTREKIFEKTGIPSGNILICATHTHSGPALAGKSGWGDIDMKYYDEIFLPQIVKCSEEAVKKLQPVTVGIASGESFIGVNRRELTAKNTTQLGQNKWGVFNPEMTVISFKNDDGEIVGNMIHYGMHGTAAGAATAITRDWSGHMTDAVEELSGGITAFFNGPEGDVGPRLSNGRTTGLGDVSFVTEIGMKAADDAVEIFKKIDKYETADVNVYAGKIDIPLKKRTPLEEAVEILKTLDDSGDNIRLLRYTHYKDVVQSYSEGYEEKTHRSFEQSVIRLGNIVFAPSPFEMFSEVGMRIDKMTEDFKVLSLSNTNGSEGYFPTEDQLCRGGYEVNMINLVNLQPPVDDADFRFIEGTLKNIDKLRGGEE